MVKEYAGIDNTSSPALLSHWQTVCLVVASIYGIIYGLIFSPFYMPNKQQHGGAAPLQNVWSYSSASSDVTVPVDKLMHTMRLNLRPKKHSALGLFYAADSDALSSGLAPFQGQPQKWPGNPLLQQDVPWEARIDNGYGSVIVERKRPSEGAKRKKTQPRPPSHAQPHEASTSSLPIMPQLSPSLVWKLFYSSCIDAPAPGLPGCKHQTLHFANSSDGLTWSKPSLNIFDLGDTRTRPWVLPRLRRFGSATNIIMEGYGVGVYHDTDIGEDKRNIPCPFKAFGTGEFNGPGTPLVAGIGCSVDGIIWKSGENLSFPSHVQQRYDTHNNVIFDAKLSKYIFTTRTLIDGDESTMEKSSTSKHRRRVNEEKELEMEPKGRVRSVAIFSSKPPPERMTTQRWRTRWNAGMIELDSIKRTLHGVPEHQYYAQVTFPFYDVFLGIVMVYEAPDRDTEASCLSVVQKSNISYTEACQGKLRINCRLAFSHDGQQAWRFVESNNSFANSFIPLGDPSANDFDSHICFAAASPIDLKGYTDASRSPQESDPAAATDQRGHSARIYYFGSNGAHYSERNTSLGLATLQTFERLAGVQGSGTFTTDRRLPITITGNMLIVTADLLPPIDKEHKISSIVVGIVGVPGFTLAEATPLDLRTHGNVTDAAIHFTGRYENRTTALSAILPSSLYGRQVLLEISISSAVLYTVGFKNSASEEQE